VLGIPLEVMGVEEPGCLGAALLAGLGVGVYPDIGAAVGRTISIGSRTNPDAENSALYEERRIVFNETYLALEPILY
jgi:sugar (pentulose or hexulose) kinase